LTLLDNPIPQVDIFIKQGADWTMTVTVTDNAGTAKNLTSYTVACAIKNRVSGNTLATPTSSTPGSTGIITLTLTAAQTSAINEITGVYDLIITSGAGAKTCLLEGKVFIDPKV
jgi:hypothetical protein